MWLLHWLEYGVSWGFFVFELPFLLLLHIFILRVSYVYLTCILRVSYVYPTCVLRVSYVCPTCLLRKNLQR